MSHQEYDYEVLIRESHLDTFGHVNNAVYLELLEEARWDLITANGFGMKEIMQSGVGPTILEINIKFMKELRLRQKVRIRTQLVSYTGKIGTLRQRIVNENGDTCSEAEFKIGLFDTRARKLIAPTPEWLRAVGASA